MLAPSHTPCRPSEEQRNVVVKVEKRTEQISRPRPLSILLLSLQYRPQPFWILVVRQRNRIRLILLKVEALEWCARCYAAFHKGCGFLLRGFGGLRFDAWGGGRGEGRAKGLRVGAGRCGGNGCGLESCVAEA
jgi:hypothetical protein